jgi:phosphoglycerate dehydrogenase-like enzyme
MSDSMKPVILLLIPMKPMEDGLAQAISAQRPDAEVLRWHAGLPQADLDRVNVVLGWAFPPGLAGRLSGLRWVCSMAAGVEKLLVPDLSPQVPMSRIVDPDQALGIAQYVAAVVLDHVRGLARYRSQAPQRDWTRHPMAAARHRVGVLGYGEVGREVGRVLTALGFSVRGWRRDGTALHDFLRDSDIVVNTLPLTADTAGLLDAAALAAMPRGSYLVNIARGGHVVEADLIAALRSGHLAGAALDVQQREPLPADDALWAEPGVTITPHIAAQSSLVTVVSQFLAGLQALADGQPLPHPVDRARGY